MRYRVTAIEGIGTSYAQKLGQVQIKTTADFLTACCDAQGRKNVARNTGISESQLLKWANLADLMRIPGVGPQFSELLEAAGVDTVKELRNRNADRLAEHLRDVNRDQRLAGAVPSLSVVRGWVSRARNLRPIIRH